MPTFRTGKSTIKNSSSGATKPRVSSSFINFMRLKDGESSYVWLTTPIDSVPLVPIHRMVAVKYHDKEGKVREGWADFVSRDPSLGFTDGDGTDWKHILEEEIGHDPDEKHAGIAVKLIPNFKKGSTTQRISDIVSFTVDGNPYTNKDGKEIFFPAYEVVFQSASNFWRNLDQYDEEIGPITGQPFKVVREGGDTNTSYAFFAVDKPVFLPALSGESEGDEVNEVSDLANVPSIEDVLETLGSHERYERFFGDSELWAKQKPWAKKKGRVEDSSEDNDDDEDEKPKNNARGLKRLQKLAETEE